MFNLFNKMEVTIRNIDKTHWREFKAEVVKEGLNMGQAINLAMNDWLTKRKEKHIKSFFRAKPVKFKDEDIKYLSKKVDEVLYT